MAPGAPAAAMRAAPAQMWTQVRIEAGNRSVVVPADQAGRLQALVARLLAAPAEPAVDGAPSLRMELARGNEVLGVLERVGDRWRWTPLGTGEQALMLRVDAALAAAMREEAEALLR